MKIADIQLTKERLIIVLASAACLIALSAYLIFYAPLMKRLRTKHLECKSCESQASDARHFIDGAGKAYEGRVLTKEEDVSAAIDELTKHGKLIGVNFIAIRPKEITSEKGSKYKILPIEMEVESADEVLSNFLGSLDELKRSVIRLETFNIVPDADDRARLEAKLTANMYLLGEESMGLYQGETESAAREMISAKRRAKRTRFAYWGRRSFIPISAAASRKLTLEGIMWNEKNPKAMIGDAIVTKGDKVGLYTVIDIKRDGVLLSDGAKEVELRLKQ